MLRPSKILVVDDEPLIKAILFQNFKKQINSREFEFYFATNGVEALEKLDEDLEIGIIITDIKMPKMDGLTLLHHLAKQERFYKIIVITAFGDMSNIRKAMEAGASDFILKPLDLKDLEISLINSVNHYHFVKKRIEAKNKILEINKELEIAKQIKKSLISVDFTPFVSDRFNVYGEIIFSQMLGGNFFDFFSLNEHEFGIVVANVLGKGIPAAIYTTIVQMLGRANGLTCNNPYHFIQETHQALTKEVPSQVIIGLFYGIFNAQKSEFTCCNQGKIISYLLSHEKKLIKLCDCEFVELKQFDKVFVTTSSLEKKIDEILMHCFDSSCQALIQKIKEILPMPPEEDIPLFCLEILK